MCPRKPDIILIVGSLALARKKWTTYTEAKEPDVSNLVTLYRPPATASDNGSRAPNIKCAKIGYSLFFFSIYFLLVGNIEPALYIWMAVIRQEKLLPC